MYIQVTDRCNMRCDHCCFSCTEKGNDMSMKIFKHCIEVAVNLGCQVSLGGGEPTLHPKFFEMLMHSVAFLDEENRPWFASNGTNKNISLFAIKLAKANVIGFRLSMDQFHDLGMVDYEVIRKYEELNGDYVHNRIIPVAVGRANSLSNSYKLRQECACNDVFIDPLGNVYQCGCKEKILGTYENLDEIIRELESEGKLEQCGKEKMEEAA